MAEIRIYLVDYCNHEFDSDPSEWDDEKFISEAEIQGNVYSLEGFQESWNFGYGVETESTLRIIKIHTEDAISRK